jgi:uncharacterized protein
MPRTVTPATSLDTLKKEARRWLKELRAGNPGARSRFERAHPKAPGHPVLRDVQHARWADVAKEVARRMGRFPQLGQPGLSARETL